MFFSTRQKFAAFPKVFFFFLFTSKNYSILLTIKEMQISTTTQFSLSAMIEYQESNLPCSLTEAKNMNTGGGVEGRDYKRACEDL